MNNIKFIVVLIILAFVVIEWFVISIAYAVGFDIGFKKGQYSVDPLGNLMDCRWREKKKVKHKGKVYEVKQGFNNRGWRMTEIGEVASRHPRG